MYTAKVIYRNGREVYLGQYLKKDTAIKNARMLYESTREIVRWEWSEIGSSGPPYKALTDAKAKLLESERVRHEQAVALNHIIDTVNAQERLIIAYTDKGKSSTERMKLEHEARLGRDVAEAVGRIQQFDILTKQP